MALLKLWRRSGRDRKNLVQQRRRARDIKFSEEARNQMKQSLPKYRCIKIDLPDCDHEFAGKTVKMEPFSPYVMTPTITNFIYGYIPN